MLRTSELQSKEVINVNSGQRLGMIVDVDIDLQAGKIEGIVVPQEENMFSFFSADNDLYVPWDRIYKIGEDVILVETGTEEASPALPQEEK